MRKSSIKKLKIIFVTPTLPRSESKPGGVDIVIHNIANELAKSHDVTILSITPPPVEANYKSKLILKGLNWFYESSIFRVLLWPIVLNFINFSEYDVVHLHGDDWFFLNRKKPTVRTFHGSAKFEAKFATSFLRKISQNLVYFLEKISAKLATTTVAINSETAKIYKTNSILGHGVDHNLFTPGVKTKFPSILFIGTWQGRKRGRFIFNLFLEKILPVLPKTKLYMVSDFCPKTSNVDWIKLPNNNQLARLYRQSWVFAYPSLYEGFGLCYLEAMASGTSIIASPNYASRTLLDKNSLATDQIISTKIIDILSNSQARKQMEVVGMKIAKTFTWDKIGFSYEQIYKKTIKKYSGHSR